MISKRLEKIASFIPNDAKVIDVGCDHALLDIYLVQNKKCHCIACDIKETALNQAIKNIKINKLENSIETYLTDGLNNIDINKNDYIVIAGMGTNTIKHILTNKELSDNLIISSNNEIPELRKYVISIGFKIKDECFIYDRKKGYVIIHFEKGIQEYNQIDYDIGPVLKNDSNYINYLLLNYQNIKSKIPFLKFGLKIELNKKIKKLKKMVS